MSEALLTLDMRDDIAFITIRRERSRNALTREMCRDLARIFREQAANQDARAIVLTGTGVAFSAGADLKELLAARDAGDMTGFIRDAQDITRAMRACPKPIVMAINGFVVGMGLELSLGADYRIASPNAVFALPERQHKLEVTNAASWLLPHCIGTVAAEELIASGRQFDAFEAHHLGLVEEIVEPGELMVRAEVCARRADRRSPLRSLAEAEVEAILQDESARLLSASTRV
jgi:enoyl-CoA hydratase/carnithine racemase